MLLKYEAVRPTRRMWIGLVTGVSAACRARDTVRLGINPWPGYETIFLAEEIGAFARRGLRIELIEFGSLGDVRRAFERGHVDGMACTMVEVLQSREQSERRPRIILATDSSMGADAILARPGIGSVRELKGKRLAVELASLGVYIAGRAAEIGGLDLAAVQLVPADQSEIAGLARGGAVDAAVVYPPASFQLAELGWKPVFDTSSIPGEVVDVVAIIRRKLDRFPDLSPGFREAIAEAMDYMETHRAEAIGRMAAREHVTPRQFEQALAGLRLLHPREMDSYLKPGGAADQALVGVEVALRRSGQLTRPIDRRQLVAWSR